MNLFRRGHHTSSKENALAEARKATAAARREEKKRRRYWAKRQPNPADRMTTNQWTGSGGT